MKDDILTVSNFQTIILQTGIEKTIDLTKYIPNIDKVSVENYSKAPTYK